MIRVAQSMLPSRAVAEEVLQETWQAVISGLLKQSVPQPA